MAEIWELMNRYGEYMGVFYERDSSEPFPEDLYHPVILIWTKMPDGKLLLTQRHPNKKTDPLRWECSGGSIVKGESTKEGALRELYEEIGLKAEIDEIIFLDRHIHYNCMLDTFLYKPKQYEELKLQSDEVVDYKFVTPDELETMKADMTDMAYKNYVLVKESLLSL